MSGIIDIVRRVVQQEMARNRTSLLGVVSAVFPHEAAGDQNNYEANVQLKYESLELRKVPIAVGHVGIAIPPRVGDLVLVQFINGDLNQPVITGRFYHADERPPLHKADDILFEQRLSNGTLNHLRFAADGAIYLQRDVTKPEDNSEAKATIKINADGSIEIKADGLPVHIICDKLTVDGNMDINGDVKVSGAAGSTTISGNEITGA
jgi:hypothetical protein